MLDIHTVANIRKKRIKKLQHKKLTIFNGTLEDAKTYLEKKIGQNEREEPRKYGTE